MLRVKILRFGALCVISVVFFSGACNAQSNGQLIQDSFQDRAVTVFVPSQLPPLGQRSLVIVLHGGMGNAAMILGRHGENGLNFNEVASRDGFLVAYLNGTRAAKFFGPNNFAWNAGGGCCGLPARNNIDDVDYIKNTAAYLGQRYGIDARRIYGIGHSNGAMMTLRVACETGLYAAAISISGPLNIETSVCPGVKGKSILSIHGADDDNVPITGGRGTKGIANVAFRSEDYTGQVMNASGAVYHLQVVAGADHMLDHIEGELQKTEGVSLAEKAVNFFRLSARL
jgi:polyhydroxybutyrate depolymerase